MATTHQQHSRASSRPPSFDGHREHSAQQLESKAGTKRLFSNRESKLPDDIEGYGENAKREAPDEVLHSGKRQRSSGWPLPEVSSSNTRPSRSPLQHRKTPNSPSSPRRPVSQARSSRFVEGSMNDRTSQKPPTTYIGTDEELRSKFDYDEQEDTRGGKHARPRKFTTRGNSSMAASSVTDTEGSRHSSIFRFGKSLAATFNPNNWKIWSKQQSLVEDEETAHLQTLRERQQKAEKMYKELKEAGHFRGRSVGPRDHQPSSGPDIVHSKHDSGIEFASQDAGSRRASREMSREDKRKGRVFLEAPKIYRDRRDESPASNTGSVAPSIASTPVRQSFHFKKPSLSNIKKALANENTADENQHQRPIPRIPSRRDMQKQQKLVKRVSDLEGKLEAARRQLSEALNEPIPDQLLSKIGRPRFMPGALASLPSERLLSGYVSSDAGFSENESHIEVGKAVTLDDVKENDMGGMKTMVTSHKVATPPSLDGKPLARPGTSPQDLVLPTVERDESVHDGGISDVGRTIVETATTISEPSTKAYDPNDGDYIEGGSDHETTPKPQLVKPATEKTPAKKTSTKKRKNTFERLADDGGIYRPSHDSESDPESEVKKSTPKKKNTDARPRKLQKTVQESDGESKPKPSTSKTSTPANLDGLGRNTSSAKASTATSSVLTRANSVKGGKKLVSPPPPGQKSKVLQKTTQSFAPPPSSSFSGLDYTKPSVARQSIKTVGDLVGNDIAYSADPTTDDSVPPMPIMPTAVRLASGEVIQTTTASFTSNNSKTSKTSKTSSGPTKLTKPRPAPKESKSKKQEPDDDFHWDRDTF
ncbi:hypothetical protein N431DRAFT_407983 [Stipitochalara longipes BDJ]|nr:hypothetical protein N431DRAFT_407983 [Stipitochalara longipes BDJ]